MAELYLLDTCIYGVLVDKKHGDYERVEKILEYAKKHREMFISTLIIFDEINKMDDVILEIVYPEYINTSSAMIEQIISNKYSEVKKLAWRYIQKLGIVDAKKIYHDALNYSWACYSGTNVFITLNRRYILSKEFQPTLKQINEEMRVKYVKIMTPKEFLMFLRF